MLVHAGRVCLLRRSALVDSDRGKWHCITGYLPAGTDPLDHMLVELNEETDLRAHELQLICHAQPLVLTGRGGRWTVFPFLFEATSPVLHLNWEHDAYRWTEWPALDTQNLVPWLIDVGRATAVDEYVASRREATAE